MPETKELCTKPSALFGRQKVKVVLGARRAAGLKNWVLQEGEAPPSASPPLCLLREAVPGMGKGGSGASGSEASSPIDLNTPA